MIKTESFAKVDVPTEAALWDWLGEKAGREDAVWLVTWKKTRTTSI